MIDLTDIVITAPGIPKDTLREIAMRLDTGPLPHEPLEHHLDYLHRIAHLTLPTHTANDLMEHTLNCIDDYHCNFIEKHRSFEHTIANNHGDTITLKGETGRPEIHIEVNPHHHKNPGITHLTHDTATQLHRALGEAIHRTQATT